MNTTPNPRATKNNKGELVGLFEPEPSPPLLAVVVAALLEADVEDIPTTIEYRNDPRSHLERGPLILVGVSVAPVSILHASGCVYRATL